MDQKPALTGELKQIYERVMNTPVSPVSPTGGPTPTPQPSSKPTGTTPPQMPVQPSATKNATGNLSQKTTQPASPQKETTTSPFLSATPPRPISNLPGDTFVFSNKKPQGVLEKPMENPRRGIPQTLIMVFVLIFLGAWAALWLFFFGFFKF